MSIGKKVVLPVIVLLVVSIIAGISYALWQVNLVQNGENVANTGCFEMTSDIGSANETPAISLSQQYPLADSEGIKTTPYTFTITNTCTVAASYQVNLETMNTSTINNNYVRVALDNSINDLSSLTSVETTVSGATISNKLGDGTLYPGQSKTYNLRLWIKESTTVEDLGANVKNANIKYAGKVTIIGSSSYTNRAADTIMRLVAGEPTNTLDVITKSAPSGETCTNTLAYDGTEDNSLRYVGSNPCNYACFNGECPTTGVKYVDREKDSGDEYDVFETTEEECNTYLTENNITETDECIAKNMTTGGWRVIGLINNVDDGTGKIESRVKLIRNESLGDYYSWDISETSINNGGGINQWGESGTYEGADLMRELNGDYLNYNLTSNPMWYGYQDGYTETGYQNGYGQNTEFDKTKALSASAQSLIGDAVWYTGAYNDTSIGDVDITASQMYINERSNNLASSNNGKYCSSGTKCNDEVVRTYAWTGKVVLIYMSDYIYATSGGSTLNRNTCLTASIKTNSYWESNDCSQNNWINNGQWQWSLSLKANSSYAYSVGGVAYNGGVGDVNANYSNAVRPAVYLKSNVRITSGDGSVTHPYQLAID